MYPDCCPNILDLWLSLFAKRALGSIQSLCRSRKYGTRVAHNPTGCQFMNRMKKSVTSMCIPAILIVLGTTAPVAAAPSGRVAIMNAHSGLCLTIAGGNTERNIVSVQYACDSDPSRRWRYTPIDGTTFRLVNVRSGLCLTIAGGGTDRNTTAVQYSCDGDPSRDWRIRPGR